MRVYFSYLARAIACACILVLSSSLLAAPLPPIVRSWYADDGLPSNDVHAIAQTPDGFLWVGTECGLARFDGVRFVTFGLRDGAPVGPVRTLLAAKDGTLWAGCAGVGLVRIRDGVFTVFTKKEGLPSNEVFCLAEDASGNLWIGTTKGVARWHGGRFFNELPNPPDSAFVSAMVARRSGELWALFDSGVLAIKKRDGVWTKSIPALAEGVVGDAAMAEDSNGGVWVGTTNGSAARFDGNAWQSFPIRGGPDIGKVWRIIAGPNGEVYLACRRAGIWQLQGDEFMPIGVRDGPGELRVEVMHYGGAGQLWVGTLSSGLWRLSPRRVESVRLDPGGNADRVRGMVEIEPGVFWIAAWGMGFCRWENGRTERLQLGPAIDSIVYGDAILRQRDGTICFGSERGVCTYRDDQGARQLDLPDLSVGDYVWSLAEDVEGVLWAGTGCGKIYRVRGERAELVDSPKERRTVWAIASTPDGAIWVGKASVGLERHLAGKTTKFTTSDGLRTTNVRALRVDASGTLWAGTMGGGLARWRDGRFQSIGTEAGLLEDTVTQIMDGALGQLWLAGPRGVSAISKQELEAVFDGRAQKVNPRVFGRIDGMASADCLAMQPVMDSRGWLCFGTAQGFVRINPAPPDQPHVPHGVCFEELLVDGECRSDRPGAILPSVLDLGTSATRIEIKFTVPAFVAPEHVRFCWRLAGLDKGWREVGGQRMASFSHLPAGRYHLEVIASEDDGAWTEPSSLTFVLHPHFWETAWFYTICALSGCLMVGAVVRIAMLRQAARERARTEKLRAVDAERARISKDLHDDLGTTLTQIAVFSELAQADIGQPEEASGHMERVFEMAQSSARALDEIVWASNPVHDTLESFVSYISKVAQDFARAAGLKFRLDAPMAIPSIDLPATTRHHLFLVSKEALHNVVKHARATTVRLRIAIEPESFSLSVEDDGCGCSSSSTEVGADGLLNMERRVKDLGGTFECTSAAGAGTAISVRVPLPEQKLEDQVVPVCGLAVPSHP